VPTRAAASVGPWDAAHAAIEERRWTWADIRAMTDDEVTGQIVATSVRLLEPSGRSESGASVLPSNAHSTPRL